MDKVKDINRKLGVYPKLQLFLQKPAISKKTGAAYHELVSTGPHKIKFLAEPTTVMLNKHGVMVEALKFIVEKDGIKYRWVPPIYTIAEDDKDGRNKKPSYILEKLATIEVGEERIIEGMAGARKYIDIRMVDEAPSEDIEDEVDAPGLSDKDIEALKKESEE